jgi:ribosome recycling factor
MRVPMPALTEERRHGTDQGGARRGRGRARWPCATCGATPTTSLKKLLKDKHDLGGRRAPCRRTRCSSLTDRVVAEIDSLVHAKEAEVLAV